MRRLMGQVHSWEQAHHLNIVPGSRAVDKRIIDDQVMVEPASDGETHFMMRDAGYDTCSLT